MVLGALQRPLDPKLWQIMGKRDAWLRELPYLSTAGSARACGVGDCTCLARTLGDLGETSGPRIDRIPPTRPPWRRRLYRELKKLIFSAPSTCPIDLFGPLANGTVLKRLRVVRISLLVSYTPLVPARVGVERFFGSLKRISSRFDFCTYHYQLSAARQHGLRSHPW